MLGVAVVVDPADDPPARVDARRGPRFGVPGTEPAVELLVAPGDEDPRVARRQGPQIRTGPSPAGGTGGSVIWPPARPPQPGLRQQME
jgi:hypothetical protein